MTPPKVRWVMKRRRVSKAPSHAAYVKHKEVARTLVHERLEYFNRHYGFTYGRVAIRDQRSRWGSCSKKGNLNFNYRIALLPSHLVDYIVVHELCHLREFNHSPKFWALVTQTIPQHRIYRHELHTKRMTMQ